MILKYRVTNRPHAVNGGGGWIFVDDIERIETHETPTNEDGSRRSFQSKELIEWVNTGCGSERTFDYELWPQNMNTEDGWERYANIAVCHLSKEQCVFVIATDECYLLGDTGNTIDRIY
jgi:hypothetical protein